MDEKDASILRQSQSWWESHPMAYDWLEEVKDEEAGSDYFDAVDRRMREGHWFAQGENQPLFSNLIPYASLRGKQVLEIGCGMGSIAQEFARQGAIITGIDLTSRSIKSLERRFALRTLSGKFIQANAEALPFKENSFDYVWSWGVLHHTPGTEKAIGEIRRVLKPGGKTAVMMYNRFSIRNVFRVILLRGIFQLKLLSHTLPELEDRYSDGFLAKHYSPGRLRSLFSDFENVKISIYGQRSEIFPGYHLLPVGLTFPLEPLVCALLRKWGWFLFAEAGKPQTPSSPASA